MLPTDESFCVFFCLFFQQKRKNRTDHISVFGYQTTAACRVPDNNKLVLKGPPTFSPCSDLYFSSRATAEQPRTIDCPKQAADLQKRAAFPDSKNTKARQNSDTLFLDGGRKKAVAVDVSVALIHNWLIIVIPMLVLVWINSSIFRSVWVPFLTVRSFI